eukprot:c769_g2_i1 orf=461-787(+)
MRWGWMTHHLGLKMLQLYGGQQGCMESREGCDQREVASQKFQDTLARQAFMIKRTALKGGDIFLSGDLTKAQVEHMQLHMSKIKKRQGRRGRGWSTKMGGSLSQKQTK